MRPHSNVYPTFRTIQWLVFVCAVAFGLHPASAGAQTVTINLGASAQNYVLTGTGSSVISGNTIGNYYNTQGSCVTSGSTTTCDLTGNFTSSTSTFAAGTYDFKTVFTGNIANSILSQTTYAVGTNEPNDFQYSAFAPSLVMTLTIHVTGGASYTIPLASNQNFAPGLDNINFAYTTAVCGGTSLGSDPCQQDYVGTVAGATYTGTVTGLVAFELPSPPTFNPGTGSYTSAQSVTLTAPTAGTTIYYTTNGSTPTASSTQYTGPITVSSTETIEAVAIAADGVASPVASATYTFAAAQTPTPAPTIYPFAGTYPSAQNVTLSDSVSGAAIYYTTDGSTPTTSSTQYTGPIAVSTSETIKAIALASGDTASPVTTAAYSIVPNTLSENGEWEWVGGSKTLAASETAAPGVYGTLGTPSAANIPQGRLGSLTWKDSSNNFWLLGGSALSPSTGIVYLNDLWEFNPTTNEWTWQGGSSSIPYGALAVESSFSSQGSPSTSSVPGGRSAGFTWTDQAGNLWMYGGFGGDNTGMIDQLYSLWKFTPSLGEWTWVSGLDLEGAERTAVYGVMGTAAAANYPGARYSGSTWTDTSGNLWLFGGIGTGAFQATPTTQGVQSLNDLWKFNPSTQQWTWVSGSNAVYTSCTPGMNGTVGQAAATNMPSGRSGSVSWKDSSGKFWLFGGNGCGSSNTLVYLNDLWKFDPSTNEWTWEGGGTTSDATGIYGTLGVAAAGNTPGGRQFATGWTDSNGKFWLLGGTGVDSNGKAGQFNDLWMFDPSTNEWAWEGGAATSSGSGVLPGIYGTLGVRAAGDLPGSRTSAGSWADANGDLWLFGGTGVDSTGTFGSLNDVWEYGFSALGSAVAPTVTVTPATPSLTSSTALSVQVAVSGSGGTPTGSVTLTSGGYTSAAATLSSGAATITIPASTLSTGTDTLTVTYTPDAGSTSTYTSATGTATVTVTAPATAVAPTVTVTPASSSITTSQTLSVTVAVAGNAVCAAVQQRPLAFHPRGCGTGTAGTGSIVLSSGSYTSAAITLTNGSATVTIPAGALAAGSDTLTATYTPDSNSVYVFTSATGTATVTVTSPLATPTVTVTPAATSITTAQSLSVTIGVAGSTCTAQLKSSLRPAVTPLNCNNSVPTGSVVLSGGGYTSAATTLSSGSVAITIPAGSLAAGTDTLTATYTPDANSSSAYSSATGTASVSVTTAVVTAPVASLSPTSLSFTAASGATSAAQTATLSNTGNAALSITSITITGSNASSFAETNTCGASVAAGSSCTISITFAPTSAATLTATLSVADNASGAPQTLTLNGTGTTPPTFTVASTTPSATITRTTTATYQLVVTPQNGSFSSPVSLTASGLPTGYSASFSPGTVTPGSSTANTTMTVQASTLSATVKMWSMPTLALVGFVLWPGRRRRRMYLSTIALLTLGVTGALTGCGGGFNFIPASKTYTITITATGGNETQSTTVQLTVQQ